MNIENINMNVLLKSNSSTTLSWSCNNREYYLMSAIVLREGTYETVQWGYLYYSFENIKNLCWLWEGKPVLIGHPFKGEIANDPEIYEKQWIGLILNVQSDPDKKTVTCYALIDKEQATKKCPVLIKQIEQRKEIKAMAGVVSDIYHKPGTWCGKDYKGEATNIKPDHLAILTDEDYYKTETSVLQKVFGDNYYIIDTNILAEGVYTNQNGRRVFYAADELAETVLHWDGKPILVNHPFKGDTANNEEVQQKQQIGTIYNTRWNSSNNTIRCTFVLDKKAIKEKCPNIMEKIEQEIAQETGTGLFSELVMKSGTWNNEEYEGKIINIKPDHIAILIKDDK